MMHPKVHAKISDWLSQAFDQIGDFCQVAVSLDLESIKEGAAQWPGDALDKGQQVAAIHRVRGEEGHTIGVCADRSLWTYLSGHLMMLMPAAIEEKLVVKEGPLEEDDLDLFGEIGNVMTGVLNQAIQESSLVEHLQLEFLGLQSPSGTPEGANFSDDEMVTLSLKVTAGDKVYPATFYVTQALVDRWFAPLLAAQVKKAEADGAAAAAPEERVFDDPSSGGMAAWDGESRPWLVVDGSDLDREHLVRLLEAREMPYRGTRSVQDAIRAMKESWCEGIFLDCALADGDGLDFLKRLRNNFLTDDLPVIVTAREVTRELVMDAIRAGATHVLVKPVEADALASGMERVARHHHQLRG